MRSNLVTISVAALLAGAAILSLLWPISPEILAIVLTVAAAIAGFSIGMDPASRIAWVLCLFVLGTVSVYSVIKSRATQEAKAANDLTRAESRYAKDKKEADERFAKVNDDLEKLKELARAADLALQATARAQQGTLKHEALFLSGEILRFLVTRQANEPEAQIALLVLPIPVGEYAEYIHETGELYEQKYGEQVRRTVERLKDEKLQDKQLDILLSPHINLASHNVKEIAERLGELAKKLPR